MNARQHIRRLALCTLIFFAGVSLARGADQSRPKRVLIISTGSRLAPGFIAVDRQVLQELAKLPGPPVEVYAENLDLVRFPSQSYQQIFRDYLSAKYAEFHLDVVILVFVGNLELPGKLLPQLFPGTPIIVAGLTEEEIQTGQLGPRVSGLAQRIDPDAALKLILHLQPELQRLVVIGGTAQVDRQVLQRVRAAAQPLKGRIHIEFWDNLTMAQLRQSVANLPARTAVLFARMFRDGAGQAFVSSQAAQIIAQHANVPVYVASDAALGTGAVGGAVASVDAFGKRAGELARLVLTGTEIKSLPFEIRADTVPIFDARALQRWGIDEKRLPPESIVRFQQRSIWQEYRWYIVAAIIVFLLQSAIIIDLLLQRFRRRAAEAELRESQKMMDLATTAGQLGLWSRNLATGALWANSAARWLFGLDQEVALCFDDLLERIHPDDKSRILAEVEKAHSGGFPFEGEFRVVLPEGIERWLLARGQAVPAFAGAEARRMGVLLDITERKRAEEKFQSAIEASPNAIIMINGGARIVLVNAQVENVFGYTRHELLGEPVQLLVPERFRRADFTDVLCAAAASTGNGVGHEILALRKDGSELPVEVGLAPMQTGGLQLTLATIVDISERKRAQETLDKERKFLRQVIDTDPNFIFAKDREGRFTLANRAVADAYGTTVENLIGKTDGDFNSNRGEVELFRRIDAEVLDTMRERFIAEERITDARGNLRWLQTVKRPLADADGRAQQVLGASTDITQRKKTEMELQEQRAELAHVGRVSIMGELAASLAHELNQPLTAILSNAQAALRFMNREPIDLEEVREILQDIVKDNSRAGEVIRRMRALVKKGALEFANLDLRALIRDVAALLHSDAILLNVRLTLELNGALPLVRGDRVQLQQVMLNLLMNAFDAMKEFDASEREVTIGIAKDVPESLRVAVSDRGGGLSGDKLDKIFRPFYTTKGEGLGMGLSICRSIIESHDGRLWAENNPARGATFYFTVPVATHEAKTDEQSGPL